MRVAGRRGIWTRTPGCPPGACLPRWRTPEGWGWTGFRAVVRLRFFFLQMPREEPRRADRVCVVSPLPAPVLQGRPAHDCPAPLPLPRLLGVSAGAQRRAWRAAGQRVRLFGGLRGLSRWSRAAPAAHGGPAGAVRPAGTSLWQFGCGPGGSPLPFLLASSSPLPSFLSSCLPPLFPLGPLPSFSLVPLSLLFLWPLSFSRSLALGGPWSGPLAWPRPSPAGLVLALLFALLFPLPWVAFASFRFLPWVGSGLAWPRPSPAGLVPALLFARLPPLPWVVLPPRRQVGAVLGYVPLGTWRVTLDDALLWAGPRHGVPGGLRRVRSSRGVLWVTGLFPLLPKTGAGSDLRAVHRLRYGLLLLCLRRWGPGC